METFLFVFQNPSFVTNEIENKRKDWQISPFNFHLITPSPSIGISEVKKIEEIIALKPYGGGNRLVVIEEMEKATLEAENALLKILEEPPQNTYLILTCHNLNSLPSTIISRCQIITERPKKGKSIPSEVFKMREMLSKLITLSPGERILLSKDLAKTKEEATKFLDLLILTLENELYDEKPGLPLSKKEIASLVRKALFAQKYLSQNVNFKATLDIFFLGFPKKM